jgi:hypothetical protein
LKTYDFTLTTSDVTVSSSRTITASLYTGITITDSSVKFEVSDNCNAVRINNVLLHWNSGTGAFAKDTVPATFSLSNPAASVDFSIVVDATSIYSYDSTTRTYSLSRTNDSHYATKQVLRDRNNLIIYSYQASTNASNSNYKIQYNIISTTTPVTITKINETTGVVVGTSLSFSFSEKLTKVIGGGMDVTNTSKTSYVGINVDWVTKSIRAMTLPAAITDGASKFSISESFLYVRKAKKQIGYALSGSSLVEGFNENTVENTDGYTRSFLIPDSLGAERMIAVHQYNNGPFVRITKEAKKNAQQILSPNTVPFDMTFDYVGAPSALNRLETPAFGRWIWTEPSGTVVNWVEYDSAQAGKKRTVVQSGLAGTNTIISPSFDCVASYGTGAFDTVSFSSTGAGSATKTSYWASLTAGDQTAVQGSAFLNT